MNIPRMKEYALACAALLGGATCFAGEVVLDEATSEPIGLNNLTNKLAATSETLLLPAAWGDTNSVPTLTIVGKVVEPSEDESYVWETGPLMPDGYLVNLAYGNTNFTARFTVAALASAEWGTIDLDNVVPRVAKTTENLSLPAAWGEDATNLKLVWTDELGDHEKELDSEATTYAWSTLPLMPGAYGVKLTYGGKSTEVVNYSVAALDGGVATGIASIDNAYDSDSAGTEIRDLANHTNVFKLAWVGSGTPELSLDGDEVGAEPDEDGNWAWDEKNLTYALYTFTNTVDGSNYIARFRVNSDKVAVLFGGNSNNVLVAKDWYVNNVQVLGEADSRKVASDALKALGGNNLPFWQSYVLGIGTGTVLAFNSNITSYPSDFVPAVIWDEEGGTNIETVVATTNVVEVWPMIDTSAMPQGTQADVVYGFKATDSLTNAFELIKTQRNDHILVEKFGISDKRNNRFYKTQIDVEPSTKP